MSVPLLTSTHWQLQREFALELFLPHRTRLVNLAISRRWLLRYYTDFHAGGRLMVADLITAFHEAQLNLAKEIENPDSGRFRLLDNQVEETFSSIIEYTPTSATELHALSTFLLDMLARNDQGSNSRIVSRLADLFQLLVDRI